MCPRRLYFLSHKQEPCSWQIGAAATVDVNVDFLGTFPLEAIAWPCLSSLWGILWLQGHECRWAAQGVHLHLQAGCPSRSWPAARGTTAACQEGKVLTAVCWERLVPQEASFHQPIPAGAAHSPQLYRNQSQTLCDTLDQVCAFVSLTHLQYFQVLQFLS